MSALRRPLGVFLQGGGSLGAWQAGALERLTGAGLVFDAVMGYSIGAVNGTALAFGRLPEAMKRWRAAHGGVMRLSPKLSPFSLFSMEPLADFFREAHDEERSRAELQAEFTIIAACLSEGRPVNARFTPGGRDGWDGPLHRHAAASCAIPGIFPPVDLEYRGRSVRLIDGGVPMPVPLDFSPLSRCEDVLVLEMVRADEVGRKRLAPWRVLDQGARDASRALVDEGLQGLLRSAKPPRVLRLGPSRPLEPVMLDFRAAGIRKMLHQGAQDADAFLHHPASYRVS